VVTGEAALQFPTDYPVKIVGRPADDFRARVHAIMLRHAPELDAGEITERLSANDSARPAARRSRRWSRNCTPATAS
jgi:putative lipoic acid-binding regulatory protein